MKKYRNNTAVQYRFSLVEILVAIAIIAILLGLSGAGYSAVQRKIARSRTEATLNKLRVGLESYKSKFGYYPQQPAIGPFQLDKNDASAAGQQQNNFNGCIEYGKISKEDSIMIPNTTPPIYKVVDGWKTIAQHPTDFRTHRLIRNDQLGFFSRCRLVCLIFYRTVLLSTRDHRACDLCVDERTICWRMIRAQIERRDQFVALRASNRARTCVGLCQVAHEGIR